MIRPFRSKVVIRNLPPSFSTSQLDTLLIPWKGHVDYISLYPGKSMNSLTGKGQRGAKAIVGFDEPSVLLDFVQKITSKPYKDDRGNEHELLVEFCSYQALPSPSTSVDPLCGTLEEEDEDYKYFLEEYNKEGGEEEGPGEEGGLSLEAKLEAMILKERELFPWKYDKSFVRSTALLEHLQSIPLDQDMEQEKGKTVQKKEGEGEQEKKKKKKKKNKRKKEKKVEESVVNEKPAMEKSVASEKLPVSKKEGVVVKSEKAPVKIVTKILSRTPSEQKTNDTTIKEVISPEKKVFETSINKKTISDPIKKVSTAKTGLSKDPSSFENKKAEPVKKEISLEKKAAESTSVVPSEKTQAESIKKEISLEKTNSDQIKRTTSSETATEITTKESPQKSKAISPGKKKTDHISVNAKTESINAEISQETTKTGTIKKATSSEKTMTEIASEEQIEKKTGAIITSQSTPNVTAENFIPTPVSRYYRYSQSSVENVKDTIVEPPNTPAEAPSTERKSIQSVAGQTRKQFRTSISRNK